MRFSGASLGAPLGAGESRRGSSEVVTRSSETTPHSGRRIFLIRVARRWQWIVNLLRLSRRRLRVSTQASWRGAASRRCCAA
jgi:hypothetical protein